MFGAVFAEGRAWIAGGLFLLGLATGLVIEHKLNEARHAHELQAQLDAARSDHEDYVEKVRVGNEAASRLTDQLRAASLSIFDLRRKLSDAHTPVVSEVPAAGCQAAGDAHLSLGAQRLYDAAAAGADVPTGACGTADASDAACAAASGTSVDAFHSVAVENASRQRECVSRLNGLIDLLTAQGRGAASSAPASP
jgi:uncharacterized membrane-anchored protein YhcB (DUF1043 family)